MPKRLISNVALAICCFFILDEVHAKMKPFFWEKHNIPGSRTENAVLLLPVIINGHRFKLQYDTGSALSVLYRKEIGTDENEGNAENTLFIKNFQIDYDTTPFTFNLLLNKYDAKEIGNSLLSDNDTIGTLGNDFFFKKHLILDIQNQKFSIGRGAIELSNRAVKVIPIDLYEHDHGVMPVVEITVGRDDGASFLFDTGAAAFDVVIFSKNDWIKFIGGVENESSSIVSSVDKWGESIVCHSNKIKYGVTSGSYVFQSGLVATYCEGSESWIKDKKIIGILGLAPFGKKKIGIDYFSKKIVIFN